MTSDELKKKLESLSGGDMAAFEEIYDQLKTPMFTIILRITRDKAVSDDILQEVFLKLYRSPPKPPVRNPRAYIFRMARNLAIDSVRRQPQFADFESIEDVVYLPAADYSQKMDIERALRTLPLRECQIVSLHINGELKFREIADIMRIPLGTVLWKYQKAIGFIAVLMMIMLSVTVFAADKFANIDELYHNWEQNGYPDYVGSLYSVDGTTNSAMVLLTDKSKADEIRASLADTSGISFGSAAYSYNAMRVVQDEITANYLGSNDKVYSVGVGWSGNSGFGESGKESRVVVSVDESAATEYAEKFYKLYGDIVAVEAGEAVVPMATGDAITVAPVKGATGNLWFFAVTAMIIAAAGILLMNRNRFVLVKQAANGAIITRSKPLSKKDTIAVIRNSETVPGDDLFISIHQELDK